MILQSVIPPFVLELLRKQISLPRFLNNSFFIELIVEIAAFLLLWVQKR